MRVVLDANVLISGVFWTGAPFRVLEAWVQDEIQVLASPAILREYSEVLRELGGKKKNLRLADAWIIHVFNQAILIDVRSSFRSCRDPDDDMYLACAIDGGADAIVSGDKDLLALDAFNGIPIVTPRDLLTMLTRNQRN